MTHQAQGGQPPIEYFYMYEIFIPEMRLAVARFSSFVSSFFFLFYFFSSSRVLGEIRREKRYELAPLDAFIVGWGPDYARKLKPSSIYASIVETLRPFRVTLYVCCFFFFRLLLPTRRWDRPRGFTTTRIPGDGVRFRVPVTDTSRSSQILNEIFAWLIALRG